MGAIVVESQLLHYDDLRIVGLVVGIALLVVGAFALALEAYPFVVACLDDPGHTSLEEFAEIAADGLKVDLGIDRFDTAVA